MAQFFKGLEVSSLTRSRQFRRKRLRKITGQGYQERLPREIAGFLILLSKIMLHKGRISQVQINPPGPKVPHWPGGSLANQKGENDPSARVIPAPRHQSSGPPPRDRGFLPRARGRPIGGEARPHRDLPAPVDCPEAVAFRQAQIENLAGPEVDQSLGIPFRPERLVGNHRQPGAGARRAIRPGPGSPNPATAGP